MKTRNFLLLICVFLILIPFEGSGQKKADKKKVTITYELSKIPGPGSNQLAVWVEDRDSSVVKTLFATKYTATGGWKKRPASLSEWVKKSNLAGAPKEEVDAITGSTQPAGIQTITWDCTDKAGNRVRKGKYIIRMEANIQNTKKMYYHGLIAVGGRKKTGTGSITYSSPELASGNVLFKNVVVEYK